MEIAIRIELSVDCAIRARLVASLRSVASEVGVEAWADDDVLLAEVESEVDPISANPRVARYVTIVDVSTDGKHDVLLRLLRPCGGIHLATLGLGGRAPVLAVVAEDVTLPENICEDGLIGIGNLQVLTESLQRIVIPGPGAVFVVARDGPENLVSDGRENLLHLVELGPGSDFLLENRDALVRVSERVLEKVTKNDGEDVLFLGNPVDVFTELLVHVGLRAIVDVRDRDDLDLPPGHPWHLDHQIRLRSTIFVDCPLVGPDLRLDLGRLDLGQKQPNRFLEVVSGLEKIKSFDRDVVGIDSVRQKFLERSALGKEFGEIGSLVVTVDCSKEALAPPSRGRH